MTIHYDYVTFDPRSMPITGYPVTGYGADIPTPAMVRCSDGRTRRVYAMTYGNGESHYIKIGGLDYIVQPDLEREIDAAAQAYFESTHP